MSSKVAVRLISQRAAGTSSNGTADVTDGFTQSVTKILRSRLCEDFRPRTNVTFQDISNALAELDKSEIPSEWKKALKQVLGGDGTVKDSDLYAVTFWPAEEKGVSTKEDRVVNRYHNLF